MESDTDYFHAIQVGRTLCLLAADQAEWSQATFGADSDRGPIGALRHLEKEAREAQNAPTDATEYADILLLLLDASRRAGITPLALLQAATAKMKVNRAWQWPTLTSDTPVEHVKE